MLRKLSRRLTYANVVATLALFVAVGTGGAYAANTVFSTDIVDGEVKSIDVGNNEIGSSDVKDNSLNTFDVHSFLGVDVVDGSLTGADIDESTLTLAVEPVNLVPASGTNGFAAFWANDNTFGGPGGYWKDPGGVVHVRGTVTSLGDMAGSRIFTLPAGYRPTAAEVFAVGTEFGAAAQVQVMANGQVHAHSGTNLGLSLNGITFRP